MKTEINSEDLAHRTAIAAARALKLEMDSSFNDVVGLRDDLDFAKRRLARLEQQAELKGLKIVDTAALPSLPVV